tara:strand:- start:112 stop:357 length:246 start_codon:yes stop_codon:yes gene_type:complete
VFVVLLAHSAARAGPLVIFTFGTTDREAVFFKFKRFIITAGEHVERLMADASGPHSAVRVALLVLIANAGSDFMKGHFILG